MMYPLLLSELLKLTPKEHPGRADLEEAWHHVDAAAVSVQSMMEEMQETAKLMEIRARLHDTSGIEVVVPGRRVTKMGRLVKGVSPLLLAVLLLCVSSLWLLLAFVASLQFIAQARYLDGRSKIAFSSRMEVSYEWERLSWDAARPSWW
jgi:hypothetical protein